MTTFHHNQIPSSNVNCAILTVSDTRTKDTDKSGKQIFSLLERNGFPIKKYDLCPDHYMQIQIKMLEMIQDEEVDILIMTGGTGIAKRDVTYEAVQHLLEKELPGFGELFRYVSYTKDIGSSAMLTRAIAGIANQTAIFSMPGSVRAVQLAMEELIIPELSHIKYELNKNEKGFL